MMFSFSPNETYVHLSKLVTKFIVRSVYIAGQIIFYVSKIVALCFVVIQFVYFTSRSRFLRLQYYSNIMNFSSIYTGAEIEFFFMGGIGVNIQGQNNIMEVVYKSIHVILKSHQGQLPTTQSMWLRQYITASVKHATIYQFLLCFLRGI